jgi:two-component system NtrC family response regulator
VKELHLDLPPQGISLEAIEKNLIVRALEKFHWDQTHAAQYLDISRKTLLYRMEKFGLKRDRAEAADDPKT